MESLKEMLETEEKRLERIVEQAKMQLENAPDGSLRVSNCRKYPQFYYKTEETGKKSNYIAKGNEELIKALAQKSYDERVLKQAEKRLSQISRITKDYDPNELEYIYLKEHPERKKLICPCEPTWEQVLASWKAEEYKGKEFYEGAPLILTDRGERVRSKSEKIIADYYYRNGIEYKYEKPLYLKGMGIVYPDYTILSPRTRKEMYHEHLGRMDDPRYSRKAIRKILCYEENGIYIGERLFLTYETEQTVLSTKQIERLAKKYFM